MVSEGDRAPDVTVVKAGGAGYDDVEEFRLSTALEEGPVVLAFYPAAFTGGCTTEMHAFRDSMSGFEEHGARVYGVSVDLPFSQNIWIQEEDLNFPMLSDWNHDVIRAYDVVRDDVFGSIETARRSIFVIDPDGTVTYKWVQSDSLPDFGSLVSDVQAVVAETATD
ncbi:MAG: redoxin domain-containing protein [Halovenus sp.]